MSRQTGAKNKQNSSLGIPEVTRRIQAEKITELVPVKLWPSLATYVREHGGSTFIRELIIKQIEAQSSEGLKS